MFLKQVFCLAAISALGLGLPQKQLTSEQQKKAKGSRRTMLPFFLLKNSGDPCDVAIVKDTFSREIEILTGTWGRVCDSEVRTSRVDVLMAFLRCW